MRREEEKNNAKCQNAIFRSKMLDAASNSNTKQQRIKCQKHSQNNLQYTKIVFDELVYIKCSIFIAYKSFLRKYECIGAFSCRKPYILTVLKNSVCHCIDADTSLSYMNST